MTVTYCVLYTRQKEKKHKKWNEGILICTYCNGFIKGVLWHADESFNGVRSIESAQLPNKDINSLKGQDIEFPGHLIQIDDILGNLDSEVSGPVLKAKKPSESQTEANPLPTQISRRREASEAQIARKRRPLHELHTRPQPRKFVAVSEKGFVDDSLLKVEHKRDRDGPRPVPVASPRSILHIPTTNIKQQVAPKHDRTVAITHGCLTPPDDEPLISCLLRNVGVSLRNCRCIEDDYMWVNSFLTHFQEPTMFADHYDSNSLG